MQSVGTERGVATNYAPSPLDALDLDLRESEARYRTLFDFAPFAVYAIDTTGVIVDFNRRAAELWGREPALGDTDERFCGSYKLFRPDGTYMPHAECPMALVVTGALAESTTGRSSSSGPTARGSRSSSISGRTRTSVVKSSARQLLLRHHRTQADGGSTSAVRPQQDRIPSHASA